MPKIILDTTWTGYPVRFPTNKMSYYTPLYIGKNRKEVKLNHELTYQEGLDQYFPLSWSGEVSWKESDIEILIDTSQLISYIDDSLWHPAVESSTEITIKSYPVFIKNKGKVTSLVGLDGRLPIVLEAKDQNQNWKAIERSFTFSSGPAVKRIILPPNELLITAVPFYEGDYRTELRLKFGSKYSNVIQGTINPWLLQRH